MTTSAAAAPATVTRTVRIIGPGRAGGSLAAALARVDWEVLPIVGRDGPTAEAAHGVDLLVLAVPDAAIASVAAEVEPDRTTVVAHLAGSLGLDVLAPHPRRAGLHPLVALPDPVTGAERLTAGAWFGIAGDPLVSEVVAALGGRSFAVADEDRVLYHAAACIASNHLVALLGQASRVADEVGVPIEAYLDLVRATVENVASLGPAAALTGPVARGDWETVARHRSALRERLPTELEAYDAMAEQARRLTDRDPAPGA